MTDPRSKTYTCEDCGEIYDGGEDHKCRMSDEQKRIAALERRFSELNKRYDDAQRNVENRFEKLFNRDHY